MIWKSKKKNCTNKTENRDLRHDLCDFKIRKILNTFRHLIKILCDVKCERKPAFRTSYFAVLFVFIYFFHGMLLAVIKL